MSANLVSSFTPIALIPTLTGFDLLLAIHDAKQSLTSTQRDLTYYQYKLSDINRQYDYLVAQFEDEGVMPEARLMNSLKLERVEYLNAVAELEESLADINKTLNQMLTHWNSSNKHKHCCSLSF